MLGAGQVQRASSRAIRRIILALPSISLRSAKAEGAGEADVEADRFQGINAHQAQIEFLFSSRRFTVTVLPLTVWVPSAQQMPVAGHLDQRIVIVRDAFRTFLDLLVGDDVVEHGRRVVDDVARMM